MDPDALATYGEYLTNLLFSLHPHQVVERECVARLITFALQCDHWNNEWYLPEVTTWIHQQLGKLGNDTEDRQKREIYSKMLDASVNGWGNEPIYPSAGLPGIDNRQASVKPARGADRKEQAGRLLRHRIRMIRADRANTRIYRRNKKSLY